MTHRTIPSPVIDNYLINSKEALKREHEELKRFGPAFEGNYDELDEVTLVMGGLTSCLDHLRAQADRYRKDFMQLFGILALVSEADEDKAEQLRETSINAYRAAENRLQGQAKAFAAIARKYGRRRFTEGLEEFCTLPWSQVPKIEESAREANRQAAEAEVALERANLAVVPEAAREGESDAGTAQGDGSSGVEETDTLGVGSSGGPDERPGGD